jgi:hypothetical protein
MEWPRLQHQPIEESLSQARLSESGLSRWLLLIGLFCSLVLLSGLLTGCGSNKKQPRASETVTVDGVRLLFPSTLPDEIYTRSTGTGATREVAVKNALLSAVQQTMGVLIVSETTVVNDRLLRDIYAGYSSGIVKSFNIVGCSDGYYYRVSCTVNAITKPWAIRETIFATGRAVSVDGQNLYGQYVTQREVLLQRRKLMDYYLSRIRTVGLVPTIESVSVVPSASEDALIRIQFSLAWNPAFRQELIDFLKRLEKDTGGDRIRRTPGYGDFILNEEVYNQNFSNLVMSWGPRSGRWLSDEVVIKTPDHELYEMVRKNLYKPIDFSIEPFGLCDAIDIDDSILRYASRRAQVYEMTIWVQPQFLASVDRVAITMGCRYQ